MISAFNCEQSKSENSALISVDQSEVNVKSSVDHGKYLVTLMDCNTCHTPKMMTEKGPAPNMKLMLSGYPEDSELPVINKKETAPGKWILFNQDLTAAVGPWGVSFAANLTPDATGLGNWTFDHFKKAMTQGKHKGLDNGRLLLPPMPWKSYSSLTDDDLKSIFEYIKTIPPVENLVPQPISLSDM